MQFMGVAGLVAGALVLAACSAPVDRNSDVDQGDVSSTSEAIKGGTLATMYPEAAYLNIDFKPNAGGYICSAALIAPRVVLTAGHCVDNHTKWEVHVGSEVRTSTSGTTYDWKEGGATTVNPAHHDIGLVFLDQPIQLAAYPTIATAPVAFGSKVTNVGRINNGTATNALYAADTTVSDGKAIGYPLAYMSTAVIEPGDSGGPDFAVGTHTIVAVNSGAGGNIQILARTDLLSGWIQQQIASHGGSGSSAGAAAAPTTPQCPADSEPNNAWAKAGALGTGSACGTLSTGADEDWFSVTTSANVAFAIALSGSGDAVMSVGMVTGSTCTPTITNVRTFGLTTTTAQKLCIRVASPKKLSQSYTLTRN